MNESERQLSGTVTEKKHPSFRRAATCFLGVFLMISTGLFVYEASVHVVIFLALFWAGVNAAQLGYTFIEIRNMMNRSISSALPAIYIFLLIGMVIASFMQSGTVPSLIYYGLDLLNPAIFLAAGLLLCSVMSVATGTSWGTVGTVGVVLIGIGETMNIPLPVIAGMIVSGATFGDKLSPISDTTNLAAMSAGTNLYRHIYGMLFTTVPTFLIVLVILVFVGLQYAESPLPTDNTDEIKMALINIYQLDPFVTLLPILLMLGLSMKRVPAEISMSSSILLAMMIAVFYQNKEIVGVVNALWQNTPSETGDESIDALLGRGGIYSMAWTLLLSLMALALGGILHYAGFLRVLLSHVIAGIKRVSVLIATTIISGFFSNIAMGEAYISIILNCQLFSGSYQKRGLDNAVLSRSVEEGSTMTAGLIPWTTTGAFYAATLGIETLEYVPYAFLNLLNPVISVVMAVLGIGLLRGIQKNGR